MCKQIQSASSLKDPLKQAVLDILEKLPDGDALCHGDYHPGNILLTADRPVIIDWPLASRGNPAAARLGGGLEEETDDLLAVITVALSA